MTQLAQRISVAEALTAARETRCLELGPGVLGCAPAVFRGHFGNRPALLVADKNTFAAAGHAVADALRGAGHACREPFIYTDPALYAEHRFVVALEERLKGGEAIPIAVGSGTINDLTKLAAHRTGRPYMTVATAASMDGYTAFGASITYQGSKQTFTCPAPTAVIADLDVLCHAPREMSASGYADLLAKTTAGADWLLADAVGAEPLNPRAWNIVQGGLRDAVANPVGIRNNDLNAIRRLAEGLMLGGFAMQWAQSSRPASGAEHQFSHLWDMQHHTYRGRAPSHGFKVGIGTLAVAALYEYLFTQRLEKLDVDQCCAHWPDQTASEKAVRTLFSDGDLRAIALQEMLGKWVDAARLREQLQRFRAIWPELREALRAQLIPFADLHSMLHEAGAPAEPEEIGIPRQRLRESFRLAYVIRRRFTVLDLAARCGLLEAGLDHIFGPEGPWPISAPQSQPSGR
jgi:glycerol-1-phosphate dehydrogenase [NAD(P)+]